MSRSLPMVAAAVSFVLLTACASQENLQVRTEYSRLTDFASLKTFRMAADYPSPVDYQRYPRAEKHAREVIEAELISRGYERIEDGTSDFRVAFEIIFRGSKTNTAAIGETGADVPTGPSSHTSNKGTLVVRVLHPHTGETLWQGTVTGVRLDPVRPREEMRQAAWRVLAEFPPLG